MRFFATALTLIVLLLVAVASVTADEDNDKKPKVAIDSWLYLGPIPTPFPVFSDEDKKKPKAADLLGFEHMSYHGVWPQRGETVPLTNGATGKWSPLGTSDGVATLDSEGDGPQVAYLAAFIEVPRWMEVEFEVNASHAFELWVDDESAAKRKKAGEESKSGTAKLGQGKHRILIKTVYVAGDEESDWTIGVGTSAKADDDPQPTLTVDPRRAMNIGDVLDAPSAGSLNMSPDGKLLLIAVSERRPPEGKTDRWMEVRQIKDGKLVRTLRDVSGSSWQWSSTGHRLSYANRKDGKATLRVLDLDSGETHTILRDIEDFSNYQWSPDDSFIAFAINKKPKKDKTGVKRLERVSDRRAGDRNRSSLYITTVPGGMTRRLTSGPHSVSIRSIHPDGKRLLVERAYETIEQRPYTMDELWVIHTDGHEAEMIVKDPWLGAALWSPDGKTILVTSGPSSFDGVGANISDGKTPNDYDTQAFLIDAESKAVTPITRSFDPTVSSVFWPTPGRHIFIVATEGEYRRLFKYDVNSEKYETIDIDCDVIGSSTVADDAPTAAVTGAKANRPPRLYTIDLKSNRVREMMDPGRARFDNVDIGDVETWEFTTRAGQKITGRIHFPPNFDKDEEYPCIVYYYGGTAPVTRGFGGRYPKNLWAAHGYVVYVLQPSGATGFGQEFSSLHVNDWGRIVAGEIIEGVEKFVDAHDYIDEDRVGCIGASFGGFMTELLVTKTDIFACAVSHAGISMISSYWGEGYWGYGYSSQATANSFPWNRKDIYVDQSPLYGADKVTTPLLLLHGGSDHNVPPGESEQMYTALKMLGKEVEYIKVAGEDHWILDYKKRIIWSNAIVSWFDRWLKDEPEWWDDMYPPLDEDEETDD